MPPHAWLTLILLVAVFVLMATDRIATWVIFLGALTVAMTLRLAPTPALLKGFSNPGVLTVAALFPVAAAMYATGAISLLSRRVLGHPTDEVAAGLRILPSIAIGSAFINNTPMVAMMIPVVRDLRRQTGLAAPSLLMGISFASILGGNTTLIGGAVNLIVAGMTADAISAGELPGMTPIGMFDLALVGVPAAIAGLAYLIYVAPRLLRRVDAEAAAPVSGRTYLCEFVVEPGSPLAGTSIAAAQLTSSPERRLLALRRGGGAVHASADTTLSGGDRLTFVASAAAVSDLWTTIGLLPARGTAMGGARHQHELVEVLLGAGAPEIGSRIAELPLQGSAYRARLVGLSRGGDSPALPLDEWRIEAGDTAVLEVDESFFAAPRRQSDVLLVRTWSGSRVKRVDRAVVATVITVAMVVLAASGLVSMLNAALLAVFAMLLSGCVSAEDAWQSVQWKTIAVLGAALGLEAAITGSGLSASIAHVCTSLGAGSPRLALCVVFAATILMTNLISNSAAAAFMFPVALSMAQLLGVSFRPFAMIIMIAASCAFINPAGFQTNLMVQKDGGYGFMDFARVGTPMTLIVGVVVLSLAPLVYGF